MCSKTGISGLAVSKAIMVLCVMLVVCCMSVKPAFAGPPPTALTLKACAAAGGFPPEALSGPIVYCVQDKIKSSVTGALSSISTYFQSTTYVLFILAVTMHGAKMISGERGINGKSMLLMVKIAFVAFFANNLGGFAEKVFKMIDEISTDVVGAYSPWKMIDDILGTLFGFSPGILLTQGLIWLGAGMMSGTSGIASSSALIVMFIELILFVIEIIYTFLTAYIVVAFMLILSPMFIPLIIFQASERYFKKWLDNIIGAMLVPVLLFAALYFSLDLLSNRIAKIFKVILPEYTFTLPPDPAHPPDFSSFWKINQSLFSYDLGVDPNMYNAEKKVLDTSPGKTVFVPSAHIVINPFNRGGFDVNPFNPPQVNFGVHNRTINQELLLALITLWLLIAILKQLIEKMPDIAQEIAGSGAGIALRQPKLQQKVGEFKQDAAGGFGVMAGGVIGGQAGAASGSARVTEAGAIGGGVIGHILARKSV